MAPPSPSLHLVVLNLFVYGIFGFSRSGSVTVLSASSFLAPTPAVALVDTSFFSSNLRRRATLRSLAMLIVFTLECRKTVDTIKKVDYHNDKNIF